jgi:outer membrane protein
MNGSRVWLGATAVIIALAAPAVRAETLAEAIAEAYRGNPTLKAQRAEQRAVDENYIQAGSSYRLQLSLGVTAEWANHRGLGSDDIRRTTSSDLANVGLNASQILLNGGRTAAALSAADAEVLAAREQLRETENSILYSVIDTYVSILRDIEIVTIRHRSVAAFARQVDQAGARRRGGDLTNTDVGQAEAQAAFARVALTQAEAQLQYSRARFASIVGHAPGTLEAPPPLPGLPSTIEESYRVAESESPTLLRSVLDERAGRARVQAVRAEANPVVSLSGTAGFTGPVNFNTSSYRRDVTGRVSFSMPLLAGGAIDSRRRQAVADLDRLAAIIEENRRSVDLNVLQAWNQVVASDRQVISAQQAVAAAQISSYGSAREFAEGLRSTFEVLNEEQRLLDAQITLANARYSRYVGAAGLLATIGRLEAGRVVPAVPLHDPITLADRHRIRQYGPFDPVLVPLDRLQRPSGDTRLVPPLPAAAAPAVAPSTGEVPSTAPMATDIPEGQPVCAESRPC